MTRLIKYVNPAGHSDRKDAHAHIARLYLHLNDEYLLRGYRSRHSALAASLAPPAGMRIENGGNLSPPRAGLRTRYIAAPACCADSLHHRRASRAVR